MPSKRTSQPAQKWAEHLRSIDRGDHRVTLGEHLINWVCIATIAACVITFAIAVFSGAGR